MLNTEQRAAKILRRTQILKKQRAIKADTALASLCCLLTVMLVGAFNTVSGEGRAVRVSELYGSMLLYDGAGGYVLVGVIAFAAAVAITVLCVRYRDKHSSRGKNDGRKDV
jgi:H+/Cl- antiporter ClcA